MLRLKEKNELLISDLQNEIKIFTENSNRSRELTMNLSEIQKDKETLIEENLRKINDLENKLIQEKISLSTKISEYEKLSILKLLFFIF